MGRELFPSVPAMMIVTGGDGNSYFFRGETGPVPLSRQIPSSMLACLRMLPTSGTADSDQDWPPYPVEPYSATCDHHTYIHIVVELVGEIISRLLYIRICKASDRTETRSNDMSASIPRGYATAVINSGHSLSWHSLDIDRKGRKLLEYYTLPPDCPICRTLFRHFR